MRGEETSYRPPDDARAEMNYPQLLEDWQQRQVQLIHPARATLSQANTIIQVFVWWLSDDCNVS